MKAEQVNTNYVRRLFKNFLQADVISSKINPFVRWGDYITQN